MAQAHQQSYPRATEGFLYEGMAHYSKGESEQAIALFQKVGEVNKYYKGQADKWIKFTRENTAKKTPVPTATPTPNAG